MQRLIFILGVVILAAATHIAAILAWPWLEPNTGYQRLMALAAPNGMTLIGDAEMRAAMPFADPAVAVAACRYVLDKGPVRVRIPVGITPTAIVVARRGVGIYHSISDKAAAQGILDVVIATAAQMAEITDQDSDDDPVQETRVISAETTGLVMVRALTPVPSQRADIEAVLRAATCEAEALAP